jgi:hypothetical protein
MGSREFFSPSRQIHVPEPLSQISLSVPRTSQSQSVKNAIIVHNWLIGNKNILTINALTFAIWISEVTSFTLVTFPTTEFVAALTLAIVRITSTVQRSLRITVACYFQNQNLNYAFLAQNMELGTLTQAFRKVVVIFSTTVTVFS